MKKMIVLSMLIAIGVLAVLAPNAVFAGQPEIVQLSPDTYMIAKTSKAGIFGNPSKMKIRIIQQANEFARSKGKIAIPLASNEVPLAPGRFASFEYQFRLVDKKDPNATGAHLRPVADTVIDLGGEARPPVAQSPPDFYAELLKLDDLRKRGIITDQEFEQQKHRLLSSP